MELAKQLIGFIAKTIFFLNETLTVAHDLTDSGKKVLLRNASIWEKTKYFRNE